MAEGEHNMTLDEAIKHAADVAETCDCKECALQHRQLANWLQELKKLKGTNRCEIGG